MSEALYHIEKPENEPVLSYMNGSRDKAALIEKLEELKQKPVEIPLIIGGKEIKTGNTGVCRIPHDHGTTLGTYHKAGEKEVHLAIDSARKAADTWNHMEWQERVAIFRKAADLISGPYRMLLNAATILGQSKNIYQAEIDSACEMIDFLRFNTYYASRIYSGQPDSGPAEWNQLEYRPLEGFVFAIAPFNFTAISGNLATAPALMGNTVLWKPASSSVYSSFFLMKVFMEAGVPDGVINFIPGSGSEVGNPVLSHPDLAGVHFTGSTGIFRKIWHDIGTQIDQFKNYPRIVGETGGKDFVIAHSSADVKALSAALVRGAFEYQGQKCSAASRAYIPRSVWPELKDRLLGMVETIQTGSPENSDNFVNAVIDKKAFQTISEYIDYSAKSDKAEILIGGEVDDSTGYFIKPTVILTEDPYFLTMEKEIFGPVLTLYLYEDNQFEEILDLCDKTSEFALTGALFSNDREAVTLAKKKLKYSAGNFYINDKPSGAVVGKQPFGGARASGTNDKAGSILNLYRWVSPRLIKENFNPVYDYRYPNMVRT